MRTSTAFFSGIGTVVVAIAAGLGGGLLLGDIMSPQQPKHQSSEVTRMEQRSSPPPITAMNTASQPVPYLATPQVAAAIAEPAQPQAQTPPQQQPQQQPQQTAAKPAEEAKPAPAVVQPAKPAEEAKPAPAAVQPAMAADQPAARERTATEDSLAKARDADIKRETRRADDRRKAERRQQWAEKRKWRQRDGDDLRDVEASVRQATEPRPFFGEPRFGSRIGLFEQD
jgi:outer membrane biosynthesis protein TonB